MHFFGAAQTRKEQEKYTTFVDIGLFLCYNFFTNSLLGSIHFDDGDISMNAMMLLGIEAVLISLLVRLITYSNCAESYALHCPHCPVCR